MKSQIPIPPVIPFVAQPLVPRPEGRGRDEPPIIPPSFYPRRPARTASRTTRRYLSPQELKKFKNLFFAARTIVEGVYAGQHKSPFKGSSPEFVDYRQYNAGDEIRTIDWKAYARTDRLFIKLFEKETDMDCYLLVDRSASMGFGSKTEEAVGDAPPLSKLEYAFYLAAALAFLMIKQGDKVSLTMFDDNISVHVPAGGTFSHLHKLMTLLECQEVGHRTSVARALRQTYGLFKRRGLLIVISDLLDEPQELFEALNMYRHRNFEIILFQVLHPFELRLPPLDNVRFIDAETNEAVSSRPADIRESYTAALQRFLDTIASCARARNIDYNLINTETPYHAALEKYLLRRSSLET